MIALPKNLIDALVSLAEIYSVLVVVTPEGFAATVRARVGSC